MKNICFIANFSKTQVFHAIAQQFSPTEYRVFWICTNQKIRVELLENYPAERVLFLPTTIPTQSPVTDLKINELLYGDRVLRYDLPAGKRYLESIQQPIYQFIQQNKIRLVFGELTWSHEILIHRLCRSCRELNCQMLNPHVVRIPNQRFAFFVDERQSKLLLLNQTYAWNGEALKATPPSYLKINDQRLKKAASISGRLHRVKRFLTNENMDKTDPALLNHLGYRLRTRCAEEWRKETYRWVKKTPFKEVQEQPYVYLGLHKQPEASVDTFGRYYEDQLQNIKNLWRALPTGWNLLIKEHTNAIGDRSRRFYQEIQKLPNVYLVEETTNSYQMIRSAKLVATVTGTMAYEAALMDVPAVTFAPVFFNRLNGCRQIQLADLNQYNLAEIAEQLSQEQPNILRFSAYLWNNSCGGTLTDPISNPKVLDAANIKLLSDGFRLAISRIFLAKATKNMLVAV
ncbi:MAG: hypothetical protein AB8G22_17910 [Saprospiraceae bacterium]